MCWFKEYSKKVLECVILKRTSCLHEVLNSIEIGLIKKDAFASLSTT